MKHPPDSATRVQFRHFLGDLFKTFLLAAICLASSSIQVRAGGTPVHTITTGGTSLTIRSYGTNNYGVGIQMGSTYFEQAQPCNLNVVKTDNTDAWISAPYSSVQDMGNWVYKCTGTSTSASGSVFTFTDTYSLYVFGCFQVVRKVVVTGASPNDKGFSTRLAFAQTSNSTMADYDFFAPGIWYKNNADVNAYALASSMGQNYFWFREDRMPLPLFMMRNKASGATFSVCHKNPDAATFWGEDGLDRVIDGRMKFASIGMENNTNPLIGITYPGSEGERTGIYGMSTTNRWALRSHPVTQGYTQNYTLAMRLYGESDFPSAMKNTWIAFYSMFSPTLYSVNLTTIYNDQMALLNNYWKSINGSSGFPFLIPLNGIANINDYSWNMGFVGMGIPNAAILLREGLNANNATMISRAEQTLDWWADNAINPGGTPRTWYDPNPQSWRTTYPTFARVVGDGMSGMLWAWNFQKKRGVQRVKWLNAAYNAANWLVSKQALDGSFARSWDLNTGNVLHTEKTNTSHVIPFLADMHKVTGNPLFKTAALNAGNYIFANTHQNFRYVGGTPDNPNVPDKEAASMALRAFLALYDLDGQGKWIEAAKQAAYYYETWVYSWKVPIPPATTGTTYPINRSTTGLSLIATGGNGADTYAAIDAFNFYRVYLYTGDSHLLQMSKMLLQNTKQAINWDRAAPLPGYGAYGIMMEALNVMIPRGKGVDVFLPWQTYNMIEPMVLLWDVFGAGTYSISTIDGLANKVASHNNYSATRNFASSNSESIVPGNIYYIVNRNSGKALNVTNGGTGDNVNIDQTTFNGTAAQEWRVVDAGGGFFQLVAQCSGKCADVAWASLDNGGDILQFTANGGTNQHWTIANVGGGYWKIVNRNSAKAMDVEGWSVADNANVSQYTDSGTPNQQWLFIRK